MDFVAFTNFAFKAEPSAAAAAAASLSLLFVSSSRYVLLLSYRMPLLCKNLRAIDA